MVDSDLERGRLAIWNHDATSIPVVHVHVSSEQFITPPSPTLSLTIRGHMCDKVDKPQRLNLNDNLESGVTK
jgi:hypothetical protein